ncbi:recombination regulator RecX [Pseudonocardia adelaidensis]|uniref:Regulatory protein RecX n=1 Tax=Pseudonocardia adelaidensis TaxID=648754 RepID=A0ABP9NQG2_9PSEU
MADAGRVARLDGIGGIGGEGEEGTSAPVARFGELLATGATPAPVADLAAPAPAGEGTLDQRSTGAAAPGPEALFDNPSIGVGRDDVTVAELGAGALHRRATRGGRRHTGAERGGSRRAAGAPSREQASPAEPPERPVDGGEQAGADGPRRRPRGRRGRGPEELDPDADPVAVAREVCLRLLTDRARTRQELATALRRKGVPDDAARTVLERFDEVGLIDDAAFAGQWVRSRHTQRGLARRAIAMELRRKGVSDEDAGEALAAVDAESEERRARELVDRKLRSMAVGTPDQRTVAGRRLVGMLARKGYGAGTAYRVVKEALAERGAESDELGDGDIPED